MLNSYAACNACLRYLVVTVKYDAARLKPSTAEGRGNSEEGIEALRVDCVGYTGFVAFDAAMDFTANHFYPALFSFVFYPVDVAGVIEYAVGSAVLFISSRTGVEWLSTGTIACFVYSAVIIAQKLILKI